MQGDLSLIRPRAIPSLPFFSASHFIAVDGWHTEDLLRPVFMGCATKNAKVITIALGSLQRLIALRAVSLSAIPAIIQTMNDCMSQGVDIQLKILQTLLSLITNFPTIHGRLLANALLLCFKLHESRTAVVSSTAAATLRQLVMFVVDKVVEEDRRMLLANELESITLPDRTTQALGPAARDAFAIFEDFCLLGNGERPQFLQLEYLHKTFALELIESVLTNYHELFRKVCFSLSFPRDPCPSGRPYITVMSTAFRTLTLITTPPLPPAPQNALRTFRFPACAPRHPCCLPLAQTILLRARDGGRSHPHTTHQTY